MAHGLDLALCSEPAMDIDDVLDAAEDLAPDPATAPTAAPGSDADTEARTEAADLMREVDAECERAPRNGGLADAGGC